MPGAQGERATHVILTDGDEQNSPLKVVACAWTMVDVLHEL